MNNKLKCLFGYHEYEIPSEKDSGVLMCKHYMKVGYYKDSDGYEVWLDYDKKGKVIHYRHSNGYERWYDFDEKGNKIHLKTSDGCEEWLHHGRWTTIKPGNWEYEKEIK